MRLCTHIVKVDTGLAPNPFWGWCTLAVCTPNHQNAQLAPGDWIAVFLGRAKGHLFLYAMEIDEIMNLNSYFHDPRFEKKKPNLHGEWREKCGDNFYSQQPDGKWIQHRNKFHLGQEFKIKDTRHPKVFIGKKFWYFGNTAQLIPNAYSQIIGGRGILVNHDPAIVKDFIRWLSMSHSPGTYGNPIDNSDLLD